VAFGPRRAKPPALACGPDPSVVLAGEQATNWGARTRWWPDSWTPAAAGSRRHSYTMVQNIKGSN